MTPTEQAWASWTELERVQRCQQAATDLLVPEPDLHAVDRDALCQLMQYLQENELKLMEKIRLVLQLSP